MDDIVSCSKGSLKAARLLAQLKGGIQELQQERRNQASKKGLKSLAFSPNGERLATGGDEGVVRLWDADPAQEVIALAGHTDSIASVAFSPDADMHAHCASDWSVRFWRATRRLKALPSRK
jgi:WD40 repeat protein